MKYKTSRAVDEIMGVLRERDGEALDSLIDRLGAYYASINNPYIVGSAEIAPSVFLMEFEALITQRQEIMDYAKQVRTESGSADKADHADWARKAEMESA